MLGRSCFLFNRDKIDIHLLALRKRRQNLILSCIIVVLRPAGGSYNSSLKDEFLKLSDLYLYLALIGKTFLRAEYRDKTAEDR